MSCLIPFMEEQIALLQNQLKKTALSHDIKENEVNTLKARIQELEAKYEPVVQPMMMTGTEPNDGTVIDHDPPPAADGAAGGETQSLS